MRRWVVLVALLAAVARSDDSAPSPDDVVRAIDRGVEWLKAQQKADGSYGPCIGGPVDYNGREVKDRTGYRLGPTAFALFALAVCDVPKTDPVIERGLEWLKKTPGKDYRYTSYESSAIILMLNAVNDTPVPANPKACVRSTTGKPPAGSRFTPEEWRWMDGRIRHLIGGRDCCFAADGGFGYYADGLGKYADVSATQFAILALRLASFAGYPVEKVRSAVWRDTAKYLKGIEAAGGFPYHAGNDPSCGMTAAAVSTLLICREQLMLQNAKEPSWMGKLIEGGLGYLDGSFDVASNPSPHFYGRDHYHYCHLYAIERTGVLSRRRDIRGKPWYSTGAAWLLGKQDGSGAWGDLTCMEPKDTLGTCFALLFLKRATMPAVTPGGD